MEGAGVATAPKVETEPVKKQESPAAVIAPKVTPTPPPKAEAAPIAKPAEPSPAAAPRAPEEDAEAEMGAAVAKAGIFAMIIGLFLHIMKMIRGRKTTKTN